MYVKHLQVLHSQTSFYYNTLSFFGQAFPNELTGILQRPQIFSHECLIGINGCCACIQNNRPQSYKTNL